jgi:hypothetical protein
MIKKITLAIFLCAFACLAQASAQTGVSNEKQAAIRELVTLMNAENNAKDFLEVMSAQMDSTRKATVTAMLDERTDLSPAERKALEDALIKDMETMGKRFQARLLEKLDYGAMIDEIAIEVYDRNFTLEEVKDLITFYKTPTGQKLLKLLPAIMRETMQAVQERLIPKIPAIIRELQEEDRREIEQKINSKKPRNNKRTS